MDTSTPRNTCWGRLDKPPAVKSKYDKGELKMESDKSYGGPERRQDLIELENIIKTITDRGDTEYNRVCDDVKELSKSVIMVAEQGKETNKNLDKLTWKLFDEDSGMFKKLIDIEKDVNGNGKPGLKRDIENINNRLAIFETKRKSGDKENTLRTNNLWKIIAVSSTILVVFCGALWGVTTYVIDHAGSFVTVKPIECQLGD